MKTYNAEQVKDFSFFSKNVYLDNKFLLLTPDFSLTPELKKALKAWDFEFIYSEGESTAVGVKVSDKEDVSDSAESCGGLASAAQEAQKNSQAFIEQADKKFQYFLTVIEKIFTDFTLKKQIDSHTVLDKAKEICEYVKESKKFILLLEMDKYSNTKDFLTLHSLRSTIYAIIIGMQIKMPTHKLIELAAACILHEIGMVRLPPQYYMSDTPLSEQGKKALLTHPVLSYNILKPFFSKAVCLAVLEHHEREDGTGYPRGLSQEKISIYGKIIAVACSYEAATAIRPYKEANDAASTLADMLKNKNKQYDENILKALLFSLSFYPVGMYVYLTNGKVSQVIDINPDDPRFPIVQIYGEKNSNGDPKIIGTDPKGAKIKRPLTKEEILRLNLSK